MELAKIISDAVPEKYKRQTHPARRTFQAIRIEVNKELDILPSSLNDAIDILNKDGVIAVITFHSLEDKICKNVFKNRSSVPSIAKELPVIPEELKPDIKMLKKIKPSKEEIEENKRSRSATLRCAVKLRWLKMKTKKKKSKIEKSMMMLTVFTVLCVFVSVFFLKSHLSSVNIEVEKLKRDNHIFYFEYLL